MAHLIAMWHIVSMKSLYSLIFCLFVAVGAFGQTSAQLSGLGRFEVKYDGIPSTRELFGLASESSLMDLSAKLSVNSDRRYGADIANFREGKNFFDNYILIEEGYTTVHLSSLDLTAGRTSQRETFDSPYSLFLNSRGHSAPGMIVQYADAHFAYESRWVELNRRSNFGKVSQTPPAWANAGNRTDGTGFPDRGANLKTIVLKFGTMRFGIQDAAVYTGRSFDFEYFLNPIPEYFTQYFKTTEGRPWTAKGNENNLIGFFWDWKEPTFIVGAQVLIDDFSLHFAMPDRVPDNPWKAAWTLGGQFKTSLGQIGFHHAGALKYTFAPITTQQGSEAVSAYGYTLFPSNSYFAEGEFRPLSIEDNALGYLHGENNLALMVTWANTIGRQVAVASQLEFVVAGTASPTNPWHDATRSAEVGTHWIDESPLARTVRLTTDIRWVLGDWELYSLSSFGLEGNILKLSDPRTSTGSSLDRWEQLWRPSSSQRTSLSVAVGAIYHWDISRSLWPRRIP